jgi:hypothetical protein
MFDRYVASMYFIFQTITTVGYGDIGVETRVEFGIAIFLMFTGVLFYSNILSELLELIDRKLREQERIQSRYHLLKTLKTDINLSNKIIRQMMREINGQEDDDDQIEFIPKFTGVIEKDAEQLLFEAHKDKFEGIKIFGIKNKKFLIDFAQNMKILEMNEGKKIYDKGDLANYFYVIREGEVMFCEEIDSDISFMEIQSGDYFGEYDILMDEKRKYVAKCKTDCVIYRVSKFIFLDLFSNGDRTLARIFKEIAEKRQV